MSRVEKVIRGLVLALSGHLAVFVTVSAVMQNLTWWCVLADKYSLV